MHPVTVILLVCLALIGSGCQRGDQGPPQDDAEAATASPSPAPSPSPTEEEPSPEDAEAVEALVRDYFEAFAERDTRARLARSTGTLARSVEVAQAAGLTGGPRATLSFQDFQLVEESATSITFEIEATVTFSDGSTSDFSGPGRAVKTSEGWRIEDLTRDGWSIEESFYSRVSGRQAAADIEVEVIAVWFTPNDTTLYVDITNGRGSGITTSGQPTLIDANGRQVPGGQVGDGLLDVASNATVSAYFWWEAELPPEPSEIRLLFQVVDRDTFDTLASFDILVDVRG